MDRMEKLSQHMDRFDLFSQDQDDWAASIFADAQHLAFDSEGRVTLPESMKVHANLTKEVAFVGRGPTFQLWNPEDFRIYQDAARQRIRDRKGAGLGSLQGAVQHFADGSNPQNGFSA